MVEIEIKDLCFNYSSNCNVLNHFDCLFLPGKINVILGSSGSGKSTLLRLIAGLENKYKGDILFDGCEMRGVPPNDRNIGYVTQNFTLYPHMCVFDIIAHPLKMTSCRKEEIIDRVYSISKDLGIFPLLSRRPKELSLGQKQRVAIARAIVKRPEIALLDEPLSNLDEENRAEIRRLIYHTLKKIDATAIYVTHQLKEATSVGERIFLLEEGKIVYSCLPIEVKDQPSFKPYLREENYD